MGHGGDKMKRSWDIVVIQRRLVGHCGDTMKRAWDFVVLQENKGAERVTSR